MATGAHVSTFSGGREANTYIREKGFEIVELENQVDADDDRLKDKFEMIMDNYLTARKNEEFAGHELGDLFRKELPQLIDNYLDKFLETEQDNYELQRNYDVRGSIGQGNWAKVPWIAILDKDITTTTQEGVYVVYLFSQDMERLYLTLNQGVTNTSSDEFKRVRDKLREEMNLPLETDNEIQLSDSGLGKDYEESTIGYIEYKKGELPQGRKLIKNLETVMDIYRQYKRKYVEDKVVIKDNSERIEYIQRYIDNLGFNYPQGMIKNFYLSLKTKPFVLLAGISGTGKTKLVQLFAEAINCNSNNGRFKLISVRPDWNDSSDLLGYKNLQGEFVSGLMINIIKNANQDPNKIYIVCLDEMNLARVEYYFSEFLSKMETRRHENDHIVTDRLFNEDYFENNEDNEKYGELIIPDNLYIVGTVNMDETTHPFSKKVLDRANTIEFSEVDLSQYNLNNRESQIETLKGIQNNFLQPDFLNLNDCPAARQELISQVILRLQKINSILEKASLHVGYRIRDEIIFFMIYNQRYSLLAEDEAFDFQLMQKILPRIQGSSGRIKEVLKELFAYTAGTQFEEKINIGDDVIDYVEDNSSLIYPRSARKLAEMIKKMEEDRFTAYWI